MPQADAAQALAYLSGALEFLARADPASWPVGLQADCLRALAAAESRQAAAHARLLAVLRSWMAERGGQPGQPLLPNRTGRQLSRDAVEHRLARHTAATAARCPSLNTKTITAHTLRHTAAMRLLQAGTDTSVIALWLGHEQADTTQIYLHADLAIKERALSRTTPPGTRPGRYRPPDKLLAFLEAL